MSVFPVDYESEKNKGTQVLTDCIDERKVKGEKA